MLPPALDHECLPPSACIMATCLSQIAHSSSMTLHGQLLSSHDRHRAHSLQLYVLHASFTLPFSSNFLALTLDIAVLQRPRTLCMCRRHARWLPGRFRWAIDVPDAVKPGRRVDERWWFPEVQQLAWPLKISHACSWQG